MLMELLEQASGCKPVKPALFPPVEDRAAWENLPSAARWQAAGDHVLETAREPAALPLRLWLDYYKTGNRSRYETVYFLQRRYLCALTMAECVSGQGRYLPAVADYVWAICGEPGWQVPAHNNPVREQHTHLHTEPLPDPHWPIIDLFAAETGATIAMVYGLLGDRLEAYAPGLRAIMRAALDRRILAPYLEHHSWWQGNGDEVMCNWTTWCTQNVLIATAVCKEADELIPYIRQAAYSLDCFLKDYGEDGCCDEGAQYYRRAALTMYNAIDLLCRMLPGAFDAVWQQPKIRHMAEYIVNVHVAGPNYLNFSDCSPAAGRRDVQDYLFAKRVGSEPLLALAVQDVRKALDGDDPDRLHDPDICDGTNLYYHVQMAFTESEIRAYAGALDVRPGNVWYPSVGLLVSRCGAYVLGIKAGCNADNHNHNDTGSITLYKDGAPLLIDIGVESYTAKTFSEKRYEIWTMQSSWHNLPEFDPDGKAYQQLPGEECRATDVVIDDDRLGLSMELAEAWGHTVPGLGSYRRRVRLEADGLHLADATDFPGTVALTLMSVEKPTVEGQTVRFGSLAQAVCTGVQRATVEAVPVTDERLRWSWPDTIYRTRLYFTGKLTLALQ